jgi:hypothetical protein
MTRIPDTRIHYASAGAVRRPRPADPARPTGIQLNYANLLDNLAEVGAPHLIGLQASGADIGERAEHLRKVLGAVTACLLGNHNVALHVGSPGPFTGMPIQRAGAQL